jgi:hypothetical protein
MFKKRSSGSDASQDVLQQLGDSDHVPACAGDNLAPRKSQVIHLTTKQRGALRDEILGSGGQQNHLQHQQQEAVRQRRTESFLASIENMESNCAYSKHSHNQHEDSFMASIEKIDEGNCIIDQSQVEDKSPSSNSPPECSQDVFVLEPKIAILEARYQHHVRDDDSMGSLDLQDIFDGEDGSQPLFSSITSDTRMPKKNTTRTTASTSSSPTNHGMSATSETLMSKLDTLSGKFSQVNFDPPVPNANGEDDQDEAALKTASAISFTTEKCGWLPWPEKKEEDENSNNSSNGGGDSNNNAVGEDLGESFLSSYQGEGTFMPWPGSLCSSGRARAA